MAAGYSGGNLTVDNMELHSLKAIESKIADLDKVELICRVALFANYTSLGQEPNELSEQPYVPFLCGLSLRQEEEPIVAVPHFSDITEIVALLKEFFYQYYWDFINQASEPASQHGQADLQYSLMSNQIIKQMNPCMYEFQLIGLMEGIFERLDDYYDHTWGFNVKDAIRFGRAIIERYVRKVNERIDSVRECIDKYDIPSNELDKDMTPDAIERMTRLYDDVLLKDARSLFEFSCDTLTREEGLSDPDSSSRLERYLEALSCSFGDYPDYYCTPIDSEILIAKPFISVAKDKYCCPLSPHIALLMSLPIILETLLTPEKEKQTRVWQRYQQYKSDYSEAQTVEYLRRVLPEDCVFENLFFGDNDEIDIVAIYDTKVILGEVKSRAFTQRRDRFKWDLKKNIEDAFAQARKAREYISTSGTALFRNKKGEVVLTIENAPSRHHEFLLLNVTYENLLSLGTGVQRLRELDLFEDDEFPWSVNLGELDIVTRHVARPTIFLHYFEKRLETQAEGIFFSMDELTLFQWYLENGGFFVPTEEGGTRPDIVLLDAAMQKSFDEHYLYGKDAPKPSIAEDFLAILTTLEGIGSYGHSRVVSMLLDLGYDGREELLERIRATVERTAADRHRHDATLVFKTDLDMGITVITQVGRIGLTETLYPYCAIKKYQTKARKWIGLGIDILDPQYPVNEFFSLEYEWEHDEEAEKVIRELGMKSPFDSENK